MWATTPPYSQGTVRHGPCGGGAQYGGRGEGTRGGGVPHPAAAAGDSASSPGGGGAEVKASGEVCYSRGSDPDAAAPQVYPQQDV